MLMALMLAISALCYLHWLLAEIAVFMILFATFDPLRVASDCCLGRRLVGSAAWLQELRKLVYSIAFVKGA